MTKRTKTLNINGTDYTAVHTGENWYNIEELGIGFLHWKERHSDGKVVKRSKVNGEYVEGGWKKLAKHLAATTKKITAEGKTYTATKTDGVWKVRDGAWSVGAVEFDFYADTYWWSVPGKSGNASTFEEAVSKVALAS